MFVFLGAVTGVLGFVPLYLSLRASKKVTKTSNFGYGALLLLGVLFSLIVLLAGVLLCYFFGRDGLIAFTLAAAITICFAAIIYGIFVTIRRSKASKERQAKNNSKDKQEKSQEGKDQ